MQVHRGRINKSSTFQGQPHDHLDPLPIQRYKPAMTALSDPIVIGLMIFNIVMLLGYFSSKWLKACEPEGKKEKH